MVGYGVTDDFSIEAHIGASACPTAAISTTWGVSATYRPLPDNEKFYLLAGWSKVVAAPGKHYRYRDDQGNRHRYMDDQGNYYDLERFSSGLNFGIGREFSINNEKGLARKLFWMVEGGLFIALKSENWRLRYKNGEKVISKEEGTFLSKAPFINTGTIFYSKRDGRW